MNLAASSKVFKVLTKIMINLEIYVTFLNEFLAVKVLSIIVILRGRPR